MNMLKEKKIAIILSIGLHIFILSLLFIKLPHTESKLAKNVRIIQAVAVNETAVPRAKPEPNSTVPILPEHTIRQIEQTTLKQPDIPKIPIAKPLAQAEPPPPVKPVEPVKQEVKKNEPLELQQPKIDNQAQLVASQKAAEEKNKIEHEKKKREKKQQEAELDKKKLAEESSQLQKEITTEANATKNAEVEDKDEMPPIVDESEEGDKQAQSKAENKERTRNIAAADSIGELDKYKQMIIQTISRKWIIPETTTDNLACQLLVHLGPGGVVLSVDVLKESGDENLDRSARNAIMKASPLPVPESLDLFDNFRALRLTFRPGGIVSG